MFKSYFLSKKWALWAYLGLFLLLFFLFIQTSLNVAINAWYNDFYNALQKPKITAINLEFDEEKFKKDFKITSTLLKELNLNENTDENLVYEKAKEKKIEDLKQENLARSQTQNSQNQANSQQNLYNEILQILKNQDLLKEQNSSKIIQNIKTLNLNLNDETLNSLLQDIEKANLKAKSTLEDANLINKAAIYYYQNLLEYFFSMRSMPQKSYYDLSDFYALIFVFLAIAIPYVLIATINIYFASVYAFKWREAMTFSYLRFWKNKNDNIEGSSQRIQEDTYRFSKLVESLGLSFIRALMTLIAFIPILWGLSDMVSAGLFANLDKNSPFYFLKDINGLLVYVALLISLGGLIISWFVGIKLPGLEYNNQKAEAAFRKELVYAEDDRIHYAKKETMIELFTGLKFNYKRLFLHYGYFNIWLYLFEQAIVIVPFIIMAPSLFGGLIMLGVVIQINNAFDQVRSSFSVFITNWTSITELRSIHKRLNEFEKNIEYKKS